MDEIRLRERYAGDRARCPFCHDGVLVEDPGLVRCAGCQAPLHATCAVEAAACASCGAALDLEGLPEADRPCAFAHACGARATAGDSLCPGHRRAVNAPLVQAGRDVDADAELARFARRIDLLGRALFSASVLCAILSPLGVFWLRDSLGLASLVASLALGAILAKGIDSVARHLRRQAGSLRKLLVPARPETIESAKPSSTGSIKQA